MTWAAHVGMLSGFNLFTLRSQGWSASDNPGIKILNNHLTLKGFANRLTLSGFNRFSIAFPGFSLRSNPGLELANAFGVKRAFGFGLLITGVKRAFGFGLLITGVKSVRLRPL